MERLTRSALWLRLWLAVTLLVALSVTPATPASGQSGSSSIKAVFVIIFENADWASITPSMAP